MIWLQVGDDAEMEPFGHLDEAVEYLRELDVGHIVTWLEDGFDTPEFHGLDGIKIFYGDARGNRSASLPWDVRESVERGLSI
jgi:hypothetical protein